MPIAALVLLITAAAALLGYLVLRFNALWVYRLFDRSLRNDRHDLPAKYQEPVYYKLSPGGGLNIPAKWPGWDGWYFFLFPEDKDFPLKMIRCSLMTGLYGLDGIDRYEKLKSAGLNSFHAIEYLTLSPADRSTNGTTQRDNNLSQHYLPRDPDLAMSLGRLETAISTGEPNANSDGALYGKISGAWPDFTFDFADGQSGLRCNLNYHGDSIVWWADIPGIFTYFAAFGRLEGEVSLPGDQAGAAGGHRVYKVGGPGAFEHGFARKPFNYDVPWLPVRLVQKIIPAWNPVRYNYQLFVGDDGTRGGFMQALGLGIPFRNRGGFYIDGEYTPIESVAIQYLDDPAPDVVVSSGRPEKFYHRWKVTAETQSGPLEYIGTREGPPPSITGNMIYYYFTFEGRCRGRSISGRGYAEYLAM
jgi:hypothetical protein